MNSIVRQIAQELRIPDGSRWVFTEPYDAKKHAALYKADQMIFAIVKSIEPNKVSTISPGVGKMYDLNDPESIKNIQQILDEVILTWRLD